MNKHRDYRRRHVLITSADETVAECERLTATPIDGSEQAGRYWRRAAKLYGMAAERYQLAGLGMRAIAAWKAAASCYETIGIDDARGHCLQRASAIPVYYEES
ncbi:MAG: hypothetical protein ACKOTB_00225 [Planctomycetia bacterium]